MNLKESLRFWFYRHPKFYEILLKLAGTLGLKSPDKILEILVFLSLVNEGDVVFDIGSHIGYYTLLFSHRVGPQGQVHAFEPTPETFQELSAMITQNQHFKNVILNHAAVGEIAGKTTLYMPDQGHGLASMKLHQSPVWQQHGTQIKTYEASVIHLDNYGASNIKSRLDFVKCDIEGAELLAFRGFVKTLTQYQPIIQLEICHQWTKDFNYTPLDIVNFFKSLGYSSFYLVNDSITLLTNPLIQLSAENFSESANLVCAIPHLHQAKLGRLSQLGIKK